METGIVVAIGLAILVLFVIYEVRDRRELRSRRDVIGTFVSDRTMQDIKRQTGVGTPHEYIGGKVRVLPPGEEPPVA